MKRKLYPWWILVILAALILEHGWCRTFKNSKGVAIEAEIKEVNEDNVTIIRTADRREFTIPINSLSSDDQEFIEKWLSQNAPKLDDDLKPGARLTLDFPSLKPDRSGNAAQVGISLPASFDATKTFPLFVWMGGGNGTNRPSTQGIVSGDKFILAGLPFPKGANNPNQSNMVGDYRTIWREYHKPMLDEVFRKIPNIDRQLCILAGFSNGAHCIAGVLQEASNGGYPEFFNCYILVDGGNGDKRLKGGKGNHMFVTWGEKSLNADRAEQAGQKASGMEVESFEMKDTGHKFAEIGKEKAREWLENTVYPATINNDQ